MSLSPGSERVKEVAKLQQKDARYEAGLFLLEGPQGLKELIDFPELAHEVFVTEAAAERYEAELSSLRRAGVDIEQVNQRVMEKISDTKTPQGVVSVVHQLDVEFQEILQAKPRLVVMLDRIQDPGNAGTIIRAADAAGADAIIFSNGSVDPYNPKVVRSTAGSLLHVPISVSVELPLAVAGLREAGVQVFATAMDGRPLNEISQEVLGQPTAWVFGNEAQGVTEELIQACDESVSIPIFGSAESLNLATAASICLYTSAFAARGNR